MKVILSKEYLFRRPGLIKVLLIFLILIAPLGVLTSYSNTNTLFPYLNSTETAPEEERLAMMPPSYCSSSGSNFSYEYISNVQIGTLNNSSAGSSYTDYTSIVTDLQAGQVYTITITPGWPGSSYNEGYGAWIDLNQDGDFDDPDEQIALIDPTNSSTVTSTFLLSNIATTGQTRMRVSMKYNDAPTSCETFNYGEVEDYTINILAPNSALCNTECTTPYYFNWYDGTSGAEWAITNGETSVQNVYTVSGDQGDYNVTVTMSNPDGQNIDFSNCAVPLERAYTATCNDPNGDANCDGDNGTTDSQFSYGCGYLTFGVTSNNSSEYTSITYEFEFPAYICGLEIGDIDYAGASYPSLTSYQDEVDVVADSMGVPVVINAAVGPAVDVYNNNTTAVKLLAEYTNPYSGDILPNDPAGHAYITTANRVTSITFTYSNGPDDEGQSDDHAIRLAGFDFCPTSQVEICVNGIDDNANGYIDNFDPGCPLYAPFDCDKTLFQTRSPDNGSTYYLDTITRSPVTFNQLHNLTANGMTAAGFNATAYNPQDRYIYGLNPLKSDSYQMYRINALGAVQFIGNVTGLTGTNDAGAFSQDGRYYVFGASGRLYEIDIFSYAANEIANLGFAGGDIVVNPADGLIYTWNSDANQLYSIDPSNGNATAIGSPNSQYTEFGSLFANEQGDIIGYGNDANVTGTSQETLVSINPATGIVTPIEVGPEVTYNDGCSCAFGVGMTKEASVSVVEPGNSLTYTFNVYNRTDSILTNLTFIDNLPTGLTFSSNPYNVTGMSLGSASISGSSSANFTINSLAPGVNSFMVDVSIPLTFCSDIENQARIEGLPSSLGSAIVSDDPSTGEIADATTTLISNCEEYWIEAECEQVGANWNVVVDSTASRYSYASIMTGFNSLGSAPTGADDRIRFNVTITNAGNYNIFARVLAPNSSDDSFWVRANGGTWYRWNGLNDFAASDWAWGQVWNSDAGNAVVTFPLVSGANTIDIAYREDGTRLDKIKVALNNQVPTGEGGISTNCPEICDNGEDDDGDGLVDCADDDCGGEAVCQGPCIPEKLFVERWFGISGTAITDLTSHPNYPNSPDELDYIDLFQGPNGYADNYGTRVRGFVIPNESGTYTFNVTGDDNTVLYLSTDVNETNKTEIASVTGWSGVTEHNKYAVQTSVDIELLANVWYYVELLVKEGTGGDHFQVYWRTPSQPSTWNIIPGTQLAPFICPEICDNGEDDDNNGLTDCLDPYCENGVNVYITSADNVICLGESATLDAEFLGSPGTLTYAWSNGAGSASTANVSPNVTTTYVVTVTNTNGCTATDQMVVTVNDLPTAGASNDGPITCSQPIVRLAATPVGMSYLWPGGETTQTADITVAGTYIVTVTDSNGCTDTASTVVTDDIVPPVADAGADVAICFGESTNLTASGGGSYAWSNGAGNTAAVSVSPTSSTTYTVTVTAANGCTDTDMVTVTVTPLPVSSINAVNTICEGTTVSINAADAGAGATYSWDFGANATPQTASGIGPHDVVYDNDHVTGNDVQNTITLDVVLNGCTDQFTDNISIDAIPDVTVSSTSPSCGVDDGTITFTFPDNTSRTNIEFSIDGGASYPHDFSDNIGSATVSSLASGTYDLYVRWGNTNCPIDLPDVMLSDNTVPTANAGSDDEICIGENTTLTATGGTSYVWSNGAGSTASVNVSPTTTTTYTVTVTAANGCTAEDNVTVTVHALPVVSASNDGPITCSQPNVILTASPAGMTYAWQGGGSNQTKTVSATGSYSVTITDANGCTNVASTTVAIDTISPTANAGADNEICIGENTTLTASGGVSYIWSDGAGSTASVNVSPTTTTTYTVTVTAANGCTAEDNVTVTVHALPVVSASNDGPITCSQPNVILTATPAGMTYAWQGGGSNQTKTVTTTGSYSVTITDANGCTNVATTIVTDDLTPPAADAGSDDEICIGESTTLTASGGIAYSWSNGAGSTASVNVSPTITTTYTVTVTAANGCTAEDDVTVTVHALPVVSASNDGPLTCAQTSVILTALPAGMTYSWDTGGSNQTETVTSTGTYSVTITDANGCTNVATTVVTDDLTTPVADAGSDVEICIGESTTLSASGGIAYIWSNGAGNTASVTVSPTTTTTYTVIVTAANGCQDIDDVTVTVNPLPTVGATNDGPLTCVQNNVILSATPAGMTYSWDTGGSNQTETVTTTGIYSVTVTDANGCTNVANTTVAIDTISPTANAGLDDEICIGESTTLTATGGVSYEWSNGAGNTASVNVSPTTTTVYVVTVTAANGCTDEDNVTVTVHALPVVSASNDGPITCSQPNVILSATPTGMTYAWQGGGSNQTKTVTATGSYSVTITDSNGCTNVATTIVTDDLTNPIADAGLDDEICIGESTTLTASGGVSYEWSNGAGNTTSVTVSPTITTTYTVTVTAANGCQDTDDIIVTVNPLPIVGATNDGPLTCAQNSVILTATPAGMIYSWDTGGNNQTETVTSTGTYSVTVTDANGCTNVTSTTVAIDTISPTPDAGMDDEICIGDNINLTATGGISYVWSEGAGTTATVNVSPVTTTTYVVTVTGANGCTSEDNVTITVHPLPIVSASNDGPITCSQPNVILTAFPAGMTYEWEGGGSNQTKTVSATGTYSVTITDANGCRNVASTTVTDDLIPPVANAGTDTEICIGESTNLTASGGVSYAWSDGAGSSSSVSVSPTTTTTYTVTVTAANGCQHTDDVIVTVNPLPIVSVTNDGPLTCAQNSVILTATPAGMLYSWDTGGSNQTETVTATGTYSVTITDANGCTNVANTTVSIDTISPNANAGLDDEICIGENTILTASGGVSYEWSEGAGNSALVTVSPTTTTTYTVTVTASNGCTDEDYVTITVHPLPVVSASNDGPITCNQPNVILTAFPAGMTYEWEGGGSNQTKTVSATGTYSVTITDANGCRNVASTTVTDNVDPPIAEAGPDDLICEGLSTDLTATGGVSYEWSHSAGNTASVTVNPTSTTTYTVTVTGANGCTAEDNVTVSVDPKPTVGISGSDIICIQTTTTLSPNSGGTWRSSDNSIAIVSSSGIVYGLTPGTASFIFTSSATGCESDTTAEVIVTPNISVDIDFSGGICLEDDSELTANVTGGTLNFTYNWSGPNGFTANTQVIDANVSGNYYVTVTDAAGCSDNTSAYIYAAYEPFIFTLSTEVCEDEDVTLSVNSATAVAYQWSANAGSATTQTVLVSPGLPSEDYFVTVTNDLGCTSEATIHIDVKPKTPVNVTGDDEICIGETTTLSPTTGGSWVSADNTIAGVTDDGTVTGLAPGTVTFTFYDSTLNCESNPTLPVTVLQRPPASISGPDAICVRENTTLSPATGGTWESSDTTIAMVTNGGIVTAVAEGNVRFVWTDSATGCVSNATTDLTVYPLVPTSFTGPTSVCEGSQTYLSPTTGGTWTSNDTTIATVSDIGVVTTLAPGTVTFTFTSQYTCVSDATTPLMVMPKDIITISGDSEVCEDDVITLIPTSPGGSWVSGNTSIATVNSGGQVTGIAQGSATITYLHDPATCAIDPTFVVTVLGKPDVWVSGPVEICTGDVTSVSASSPSGIWSSSDESIALVSVDGTVVGMSGGTATFSYTDTQTCVSDASVPVIVNPPVDVDIDYIGSVCLEDDTKLVASPSGGTPGFSYSWSGPGGFTSNLDTIDIVLSGLYNVLVTDGEGCSSNKTAYVYEAYNPFIFTLDTEICEGEDVTLSVNGSSGGTYQWSANTGSLTSQSVTVTPSVPGETYYVTITSPQGCTTVANTVIDVEQLPVINLTGQDSICMGQTTTFTPGIGGVWSSSNYDVASITNSGVVTALSPGAVTFTFRDTSSGCYSAESTNITVNANDNILINGDGDLCLGIPETLTASVLGGTWSSSNPGIASIDAMGAVTPIAEGSTTILYTPAPNTCYNVGTHTMSVNTIPTVDVNGPSTICEGEITYLVPSNGGTWESSDTTVATVNAIGIVTGVSGGSASFTFTSTAGCIQTLSAPINVVPTPVVSLTGPSSICIDESTTLSPTSGGIWLSSNNLVASVSSSGVVLGKSAGTAQFTFIEIINGCISSNVIEVTVDPRPNVTGLGDSNICIGETTTISPSTGGSWTSSDTTVATITSSGLITAVGAGAATFTYTDASTGCSSYASSALTVDGRPTINISGATELCVGDNSSILPNSGGVWSTSDVSVATITSDGTITAVSAGTVTFTYTSDLTGCSSLASDVFTVSNPTTANITGTSILCIGATGNLVGSESGTWTSSNNAIATVNSAGVVTGHAPGMVTITLNTTASCITNPTYDVQVEPNPNPIYTGSTSLCLGETTSLSPTTGGIWTSSNDAIATIDHTGNVTTLTSGVVNFSFTDTLSGCSGTTSSSLSIFELPEVEISGNNIICVGETTSMSPSSGGSWSSNNTAVATINSNGVVTAISAGTATFTYTETGTSCTSLASEPVTVLARPNASITGSTTLCVGETSTLSPTTGGSWISSDESVATVTDQGVVTAVAQGVARFTFVANNGCASNQTSPIIVFGIPSIGVDGVTELCVGESAQMLPSSGGLWVSSNELVATITNDGVVTTLSPGTVSFTFTDSSTGCISDASEILTISAIPNTAINGPSSICIGSTTNFTPTAGGVWSSVDPSVASIQNNGDVTGISAGTVRFIFTNLTTGCVSDTSSAIIVTTESTPIYIGSDVICIGDTTYLSPSSGGTWESTNTEVATIDNSGMIIGVGQGTARFRFTNSTTGCVSDFSTTLTVNGVGTVFVNGSSSICIGTSTTLSPSSGGSWVSLSPGVAVVSSSGVVTGVTAGTANFVFTDSITGCSSDGSLGVIVQDFTEISINSTGGELCIGYTLQMTTSTSGGVWTSSNKDIASISNSGIVRGRAPGKVTFTYTESIAGCVNSSTSDTLVVNNCMNHDFNVAVIDQQIFGNVSTNDNYPTTASYSSTPQLVSKPDASIATFTINADGSYSFQGNKAGNYRYNVPVCLDPIYTGCPTSMIEFTLVENQYSTGNPVTNLDIATMFGVEEAGKYAKNDSAFWISTIQNDVCIYTLGCDMDWSSAWLESNASNGWAEIMPGGIIEYTPDVGYIGFDTIYYGICADGYSNCNNTMQIMTINHSSAQNTVVAADDFQFTLRETAVSGNLLTNDSDAEGDSILVTPQGAFMAPIITSAGQYYIDALGNFNFTPNGLFSGHTEIIYEICDDNPDQACMQATLHLLVFDDIAIKLRVYLEGALMQNGGAVSSTGRPLMRDNLRVSPFTGLNYIPLYDPYTISADPFVGTPSRYNKIGPGQLAENQEITDSLGVFGVIGENAIVDWVHVELRSKDDYTIPIATRSGLLQRDGDIVDLDGVSDLRFNAVNVDSFYVVVKHRSHLGVMSEKVGFAETVDFTSTSYPVFNFEIKELNDYSGLSQKNDLLPGYSALWAGDFDSNGKIKFTNPSDDQNVLFFNVLFSSPDFLINYDQAYGYMTGDFNMNSKSKFTNPSDDINFLFSQILLYPLNSSFLSNYNSLIEQVPEDE